MNPAKISRKRIKPLFLVVALLLLIGTSHAQGFQQSMCAGTGAANAIIPASVLTGQTAGEQNVLTISVLIMLVVLVVVAVIYMISSIMQLDLLKKLVKSEITEVIITALIVFVFIGSFNLAGLGLNASTNVFHIAGSRFGKGLFVDDCTYLVGSSLNLIPPIFQINIVRFFLNTLSTFNIQVMPSDFGFADSPFQGFALFDKLLGTLEDIAGAFLILNMATALMIGLIFGLFPVFLYAGIILRTLPWTRAAGGAFLGIFVGFYIAFPILLHVMLGGYVAPSNGLDFLTGINSATFAIAATGSSSAPSFLSYGLAYLGTMLVNVNLNGLVTGFISVVLEPAVYTFISIIVSFIIAFDIAEITGDMLGAPNLTANRMFNRLI